MLDAGYWMLDAGLPAVALAKAGCWIQILKNKQ
jgi:hypothetical protein